MGSLLILPISSNFCLPQRRLSVASAGSLLLAHDCDPNHPSGLSLALALLALLICMPSALVGRPRNGQVADSRAPPATHQTTTSGGGNLFWPHQGPAVHWGAGITLGRGARGPAGQSAASTAGGRQVVHRRGLLPAANGPTSSVCHKPPVRLAAIAINLAPAGGSLSPAGAPSSLPKARGGEGVVVRRPAGSLFARAGLRWRAATPLCLGPNRRAGCARVNEQARRRPACDAGWQRVRRPAVSVARRKAISGSCCCCCCF